MKVAVVGLGIYSLAISKMLAKNDNKIKIWTEDIKKEEEFKNTKQIKSIVDTEIPKNIYISNNLEKVLTDCDIIYIITASKYVNSIVERIKEYYKKGTPVCIASKGIDEKEEKLLSDIVGEKLKTKHVAMISGPTFAVDILNNEPVALAIGASSLKARETVIKTLANDTVKLRPTKDMIGIELCGAIKNVIAIASGILRGLGYSDSTQCFLINESLHDIKDIIYYFGGNPKTILSFAGVGDLILTCSSPKSRNYSFGYVIGHEKNEVAIKKYLLNNTVEGYYTLATIYKMLKDKHIKIDLIEVIYDIVYNYKEPDALAKFLIKKK